MEKFVISGGKKLSGKITVSGAKNAAMKVILCGLLTSEPLHIENVPLITSVIGTADLMRHLGVKVNINQNHTLDITGNGLKDYTIPLDLGGLYRTATMVIGPLLCRFGRAVVPNPGGCRLGKRPVDWHIEGLKKMGAKIKYNRGYFRATCKSLKGTKFRFPKNTHTGTETMILAAVKAEGDTFLENVSQEPEVDDLINLLLKMGAKIKKLSPDKLAITGVKKLRGASYRIMPDRNEAVTFAIAAVATDGSIEIKGARQKDLTVFLEKLKKTGADYSVVGPDTIRFFRGKRLTATHITTKPHPGFMTDWQAPWALLMTQAWGSSTIHETIFEDRFNYVAQLKKMGAQIEFYHPRVKNPKSFYNFNWADRRQDHCQAIRITGKNSLHEAILEVNDLRAGATLVLAAAVASGKSTIYGIEHIDRGYEKIEKRLEKLGLDIKRLNE